MCGAHMQSLSSATENMRPEFACSLPVRVGETAFLECDSGLIHGTIL